eukprot:Rhum_TRINITY_DN4901_c0_g1::Rhum_TRINITY_DN4901_c0_g1_i1::g.16007::m.16007
MVTEIRARAVSYRRMLGGAPPVRCEQELYARVALAQIICEARRLDRKQAGEGESRRLCDVKWRFILSQIRTAQARKVSCVDIRADLAARYPFLGMLTEADLEGAHRAKRDTLSLVRPCSSSGSVPPSPVASEHDVSSGAVSSSSSSSSSSSTSSSESLLSPPDTPRGVV